MGPNQISCSWYDIYLIRQKRRLPAGFINQYKSDDHYTAVYMQWNGSDIFTLYQRIMHIAFTLSFVRVIKIILAETEIVVRNLKILASKAQFEKCTQKEC